MSVKIILPGGLCFPVCAATEFITPQKSTKILSEDLKKKVYDEHSMHTKKKLLEKNDSPI